jgi:hypothetical protein
MPKFADKLDEKLKKFIAKQKMFFTATAPEGGRINLSPKGIDTFRVIDDNTVGYLDLTGSGNETSAHVQENGRMTIMFCSFTKTPLILRLYGNGEVVRTQDEKWNNLSDKFTHFHGERQIILLNIKSLQTSCGYGVPIYELQSERDTLLDWCDARDDEKIKDYWRANNLKSIDGQPINLL